MPGGLSLRDKMEQMCTIGIGLRKMFFLGPGNASTSSWVSKTIKNLQTLARRHCTRIFRGMLALPLVHVLDSLEEIHLDSLPISNASHATDSKAHTASRSSVRL